MERFSSCRLFGGAVSMVALIGCGARSPFTQARLEVPIQDRELSTMMLRAPSATAARQDELPDLDDASSLDDYQRYAALANPGLEAMFQQWRAAVERLPQVSAPPDPRLTYGYYLGEVETRVGPMRHSISVSQTIPWFGKLRDREDAAARHANSLFEQLEATRLALYLKVASSYNELFYLKRSIDITRDNMELLQQFERVARARYRVAAAAHPDIIRIQVELGTLEDRLRQLEDLRAPAVARLNAALNRPSAAVIPWPVGVSESELATDHETLFAIVVERNPELLALQEEIERERIGADLARKERTPDLTVGLAYTVIDERPGGGISENGDDALLGTVSINLPIWVEKYDAAEREAIAKRLEAAGRLGDATNRLAAELQEAIYEHDDARRRIELYRNTLIPKATESLQALLGSFEQGESDFLDLVDAQRTLLEFQLGLERAHVDRATSFARIERVVAANLNEFESPSNEEDGQ